MLSATSRERRDRVGARGGAVVDSNAEVADALRRFILEHFPAARQRGLQDDAPLLENGIVDSLGILELVTFVSEAFGVSVGDEELQPENFASLRQLAAFVERRRGGEGPREDPRRIT